MNAEGNVNPTLGLMEAAGGLTVLLADDEDGIRRLVAPVLRSHGFTVLEAADGKEALELAERHDGPIHLLLTDWSMPRLNGGELIRRLNIGRPRTAVLVMSGYAGVEALSQAPVLRKPFKPQDLVNAVQGALEIGSNCA